MLQQTQASRVIPKWHAFLERFPSPAACAEAALGDVLQLWQGLGYPRRAKNLHDAAARIADLGEFPSTLAALLQLPGVGQYTARAVLAFAFEQEAAVVDTNTARVLARVVGVRLTARQAQEAADAYLPPGDAWAWNQCLMDLGAVLCRPAAAHCDMCPLQTACAWHGSGDDPAVGSAGVSTRQARFDGSDRQARGRLMRSLNAGPVTVAQLPVVMRCEAARAGQLTNDLEREGLVVRVGPVVCLPT